jgi:hypothetical protein
MNCGEGGYLVEFIENPLEHFLMRARVAKYYDEYVRGSRMSHNAFKWRMNSALCHVVG